MYSVTTEELQELHSMVYLSRCKIYTDIDSIIQRALIDYLDIRSEEVEEWKKD